MIHLWWKSTRGVVTDGRIATCKFQAVTLGREKTIAKSWLDGQEPDTKAYQADKLEEYNEVPNGDRNLGA